MAQVITFERVVPIARYDATAWTEARIEEATTSDGVYTEIETITLSPVEVDPTDPLARNLTTELASDGELWYRIIFIDATGDESAPTDPIQNATSSASTYATVDELARRLKIRTPSDEQSDTMQRVLSMAAGEINSEIDRATTDDELSGWQLALAAEVNLQRAEELWQETPFGVIGLGSDFGTTHTAKNSWERHAHKLSPLKTQWGMA